LHLHNHPTNYYINISLQNITVNINSILIYILSWQKAKELSDVSIIYLKVNVSKLFNGLYWVAITPKFVFRWRILKLTQ